MFKLPKLLKPKAPLNFLALDIGSKFVKALIFKLEEEKATVLGVGKQPLEPSSTYSGVISNLLTVEEAVRLSINEAVLTSTTRPKNAIVNLSGRMIKGLTTTARLTRANPQKPLSKKEFSQIKKKVGEAAFMEGAREMAKITGNPDLEIKLVDSHVTLVKMDGFLIGNPLDFKGRKMEISLFTALSPTHHLESFSRICKNLGLKVLKFVLGVDTLIWALGEEEPTKFNAIIIDVGGETTDVGIVFGGGILSTRTLDLGGKHFTEALAEELKISISEAEEKKLRYAKGDLEEGEESSIKEAFSEILKLWLSGVTLIFSDFEGVKTFPSRIYLAGGGAGLPEIKESLSSFPWTKSLPFRDYPKIKVLGVSDLKKIRDNTASLLGVEDVIPASLGVTALSS